MSRADEVEITINAETLASLAGAVVRSVVYPDEVSDYIVDYIVLELENADSGERFRIYADAPTVYRAG